MSLFCVIRVEHWEISLKDRTSKSELSSMLDFVNDWLCCLGAFTVYIILSNSHRVNLFVIFWRFSYRQCNRVILNSLQAIGNIVSGNDDHVQTILNYDIFPALYCLLYSKSEKIVRDTLWVISNIAAGNTEHVQAIINANIFPIVIKVLQTVKFDTSKRAIWILTNATFSGTPDQIRYMVSVGCIPLMLKLLNAEDLSIVKMALIGLENILEIGEPLDLDQNPYVMLTKTYDGERTSF